MDWGPGLKGLPWFSEKCATGRAALRVERKKGKKVLEILTFGGGGGRAAVLPK